MKKNKKYWKAEAKGWKEVSRIESEQANDWANKALKAERELEIALDMIEKLNKKFDNKPITVDSIAKKAKYPIWQYYQPKFSPSITSTSYEGKNIFAKKCNCNCSCKND